MSTANPVRWGILGCGNVTEIKSGPAYQQVEGFSLDAVMARTPGKAEDYARRHQIPRHYTDAHALIHDPQLDAIYIATPPDSHFEYALEVARAGKICSVEKPMALNFGQCVQMAAAFEKAGKPLFVAYYRRSLPGFKALKGLLQNNPLGQIRQAHWHYHRPASASDQSGEPNWRTDASIAPAGYFDDLACHGLDILTFLLGYVETATGVSTNQQSLYTAKDSIAAALLFESGVTASCSWNFGAFDYKDRVEIIGDGGVLTFSIFGDDDAILRNRRGEQRIEMPKPDPIQQDFVNDMYAHLQGIARHPSMAASAAHTSWIMDSILARP